MDVPHVSQVSQSSTKLRRYRGLLLRSYTPDYSVQVHDAAAGRAAYGVGHRLHDLLYAHGKK
jgi:hypothetical protein